MEKLSDEVGQYEIHGKQIVELADIPDIFGFNAPIEYLVDGLFPRSSLSLLSGAAGIGKSYFTLNLGVACALGEEFLGCACEKATVLYLDRENPISLIQSRLRILAGGAVPNLFIWGNWLAEEPPIIGDARLRKLAGQRLLIIFDSFVRFHSCDENSATEMRGVMEQLRRLANLGATVIVLHHCSKSDGNKYRGSSDILAGVDLAYSVEKVSQGLLRLHRFKSRFSGEASMTIKADFANGSFDVTQSPQMTGQQGPIEKIAAVISQHPGSSQNQVIKNAGVGRSDGCRILKANKDQLWRIEHGRRRTLLYFPRFDCPDGTVPVSTTSTGAADLYTCTAPVGGVQSTGATTALDLGY